MDRHADPAVPPQNIETERTASSQRAARVVLAVALVLFGLWIVHRFLPALAWALILAIALWPLYERLMRALAGRGRRVLLPLAVTLVIALVFVVPLVYAGIEAARESGAVVQYLEAARRSGVPMPEWVPGLPGIGHPLAEWWRANLSDPKSAKELLGRFLSFFPSGSARQLGGEIVHRMILFAITLLTLFFLFRDGAMLGRQLRRLSHRLFGSSAERVGRHMIAAVHGTVTGLVLVGLGEGVLLGFAYIFAGLPHPVAIAGVTGILAVIPFGAPLAFCVAGLYLAASGNSFAGAAVVAWGFFVVFVADHFIRPILIGGAARLPFLWVLLGIIGGLETFGLLGLFLGPVVMAALISLWRDWTQTPGLDEPPPAADGRPPAPPL